MAQAVYSLWPIAVMSASIFLFYRWVLEDAARCSADAQIRVSAKPAGSDPTTTDAMIPHLNAAS